MKTIYTALITPFHTDGSIDFIGLEKIMEDQINDGVDGFIVNGTTAECLSLTDEEQFLLLDFVCEKVQGKVAIYFGCGCSDTLQTLKKAKKAQNYPIDGLLIVTPYYNKPNQEGLYQHYVTIAHNVNLPIILYQVESRTGVVFEIETLQRICKECPSIFALKYASKDIVFAKKIRNEMKTLTLFCGDDSMIKECDEIGMDGIISVTSHIALPLMKKYYSQQDKDLVFFLQRIAKFAFLQSNPSGIKYLLSKHYGINDVMRLPLVGYTNENKRFVDSYFDT